jgi:L-threonylcarbamoyladenylate synthase
MQLENNVEKVIKTINSGGIVCIPTDTLFAISCDATDQIAVDKLYHIKKRDREKKLPIFFRDINQVQEHCEIPKIALNLTNKFWPGKLTIILKLKENSNIARNALDTENSSIAVRIPNNANVLKILKSLDKPIVGTSANISGNSNINSYEELEEQFKNDDVLIFKPLNYKFKTGIQSTIVSFEVNKPIILREGAISYDEIIALTF